MRLLACQSSTRLSSRTPPAPFTKIESDKEMIGSNKDFFLHSARTALGTILIALTGLLVALPVNAFGQVFATVSVSANGNPPDFDGCGGGIPGFPDCGNSASLSASSSSASIRASFSATESSIFAQMSSSGSNSVSGSLSVGTSDFTPNRNTIIAVTNMGIDDARGSVGPSSWGEPGDITTSKGNPIGVSIRLDPHTGSRSAKVLVKWFEGEPPGGEPDDSAPYDRGSESVPITGGYLVDIPAVNEFGVTELYYAKVPETDQSGTYAKPPEYFWEIDGPALAEFVISNPLPMGDSEFELVFNGFTTTLTAGVPFDFTAFVPDGVSSFILKGIDLVENLNPDVPFPFVHGMRFTESGPVTVAARALIPTPGDFDGDGVVGPDDYDKWKATFGSTTDLAADGNGDGIIDAADYTVWRDNLQAGQAPGVPAEVPEPGSELLAALASLLWILRKGSRKRHRRCHPLQTRFAASQLHTSVSHAETTIEACSRSLSGQPPSANRSPIVLPMILMATTVGLCFAPFTASAVQAQPYVPIHRFDDPTITGFGFDEFGYSVALDGDRLLIGAPGHVVVPGGQIGQAHLFDAAGGALLMTFDDPTVTGFDRFGTSVALSGDRVLIGAPSDTTRGPGVGQAYLFDANSGALLQTFDDPTPTTLDGFGWSVALHGDRALIGAPGDDTSGTNVGQAHLFDVVSGTLLQTFEDPTVTTEDGFGTSVALDVNHAVIGAPLDGTQAFFVGQAHLFDVATGTRLHTFDDPAPMEFDQFGHSVALSGENILVGAPGNGQAHLFDAAVGELQQTFDNPGGIDSFAASLAVDGKHILIGAVGDASNNDNFGQAYLFDGSTGAPLEVLDDPHLSAGDSPGLPDQFGWSVALDRGRVLVSDPYDNSGGTDVGQVYLFSTVPEPNGVLLATLGMLSLLAAARSHKR